MTLLSYGTQHLHLRNKADKHSKEIFSIRLIKKNPIIFSVNEQRVLNLFDDCIVEYNVCYKEVCRGALQRNHKTFSH